MGSTWRETKAIKANFMKLQIEDAAQGRNLGVGIPCAKDLGQLVYDNYLASIEEKLWNIICIQFEYSSTYKMLTKSKIFNSNYTSKIYWNKNELRNTKMYLIFSLFFCWSTLATALILEPCHFACLLRSLAIRFASGQVETTQYPVQQL